MIEKYRNKKREEAEEAAKLQRVIELEIALGDTDAIIVDQEFRLTLLELGITDFDEEEI